MQPKAVVLVWDKKAKTWKSLGKITDLSKKYVSGLFAAAKKQHVSIQVNLLRG